MASQKQIEREAARREAATAAFIEHKKEIDRLLVVISEESTHHFGVDSDTLNWADVGNISRISVLLTEVKDIIKNEGEYAV